jgi:hypothetical protein
MSKDDTVVVLLNALCKKRRDYRKSIVCCRNLRGNKADKHTERLNVGTWSIQAEPLSASLPVEQ